VDAAYLHYESGDSPRAKAQLHDLIAMLPPGHARARALLRLARVRVYESLPEAAELFLQAVREAEGDRELLAAGYEGVATCRWQLYERLDEAVEQAELAARLALEVADRGLAGEALNTQFMAESLLGRKTASATIARALEYQPAAELRRVLSQPRWVPEYLAWTGTLARSRDELEEMLRCASELGDESAPPYVLAYLSLVECALGELDTAVVRARAAQDASEQAGQRAILAFASAIEGLVEAQRGRDGHARAAATRAFDLVAETGDRQAALVAAWALGHLDLTAGALDAAVARMEPSLAFVQKEGISEPCAIPFVIDHIEALVGLGRLEESGVVLDWHEGNARRLGRGLALANCLRCRGLLAAQTGAPDQAVASYQEALDWHSRAELPLDRGRTLLALGSAQRRARRRREARETLEEALEVFERIGAGLWAQRARAELKRISGRTASPGALTPAEARVAALVAEGRTNREAAATLFVSERTIEGHLSRIFAKLGVRSRAELARELATRQEQVVAASNAGDPLVSETPTPS
jgi:DNA-binding CsgD family transcriptional regulator